jgi:HD-like signal output (HDOD) protein
VFRVKGYEEPMNAIRRHSVACAYLARKICEKSKLPEGYAFLCGLLHDAGMAAGLIVLADVRRGKTPPAYDRVREAVDSVHANASHVLAKNWGLPHDIQSVLINHHRFSFSDKPDVTVAVISVADMLVTQAGLPAGGEQTERQGTEAARALRLSSERLAELAAFAKAVREHLV